jgi:uncharacterized protein
MEITSELALELGIKEEQVSSVVELLKEGNTIPFIARYRKEKTGSLDDVTLRNLFERLSYLEKLEERRKSIKDAIKEEGKLTPELEKQLDDCLKLTDLEALYRPYKKKKKTRASIAKEAGLSPLADYLLKQEGDEDAFLSLARNYKNPEKGFDSVEKVIGGAEDIIAEKIADISSYSSSAKAYVYKSGRLSSKETKNDTDGVYKTYASFSCQFRSLRGYQVLALSRGEKEKKLTVSFDYDRLTMINAITRDFIIISSSLAHYLREAITDCYKRLIEPSVLTDIRSELFTKAEDEAIVIFKKNLRELLLQAPLKDKRILGFDPAFVNGCKLAAVDEHGSLLDVAVIYPTVSSGARYEESKRVLLEIIKKYKLDVIALGNGTASRESKDFLISTLEENHLNIPIYIVSEAGASVYSASPLASKEFPELTVEKRSAISLARRLIDPLSELVKINPCSIGVGQYQHDMDSKKLSLALSGVVEDCVNEVGVYVNEASPSLLSYVSGIGPSLAQSILKYRETNGAFTSRDELKKVPHLGDKAFTQSAGFLRIRGTNPLDNTAVHPESYAIAKKLLSSLSLSLSDLGKENCSAKLNEITDVNNLATTLGVGEETLKDIIASLVKPGRDPRETVAQAELISSVKDIKDLKVGMILSGTIRNVMAFGAFVDIGVHQDGLVHISELANHFVSSPFEVVSIGEIVKVKVISIDLARGRIGLSMKQVE